MAVCGYEEGRRDPQGEDGVPTEGWLRVAARQLGHKKSNGGAEEYFSLPVIYKYRIRTEIYQEFSRFSPMPSESRRVPVPEYWMNGRDSFACNRLRSGS
jgi:hypothetical protein